MKSHVKTKDGLERAESRVSGDADMAGDSYNSDEESETDIEERKKYEIREKDIKGDCSLMESLFQNDQAKSQRLLAVLTSHNRPINCVRWNNLGTMFASADDEGTIILWEYRGLTIQSAF